MHSFRLFYITFLLLVQQVTAQTLIKGEIKDFGNNQPLDNVNVRNIYSMTGMTTLQDGLFGIKIKKGELVEFSKLGYQTLRIRISNEAEPSYYKLVMKKAPIELREVDIRGKPLDFKKDSMRYREVYDIVLRKENQAEVDIRSMPLAMLSKKNREEWAFQKMYAQWESEKYIDLTFNERLVHKITYLEGDSLLEFMKLFRPSVSFLRSASEYEYLNYIKYCFNLYTRQKK
ncbi:MAG: hypothetical protein E6Q39_01865 [Crocinitomicaceae bacterium]|nr:MAG: hypothetical protein E6Q39_01865 [Crocinitomicaceae bacterium]